MAKTSVVTCDVCGRERDENELAGWAMSSVTEWDKDGKPVSWEQDLCPDHAPEIPAEHKFKPAGPVTAI